MTDLKQLKAEMEAADAAYAVALEAADKAQAAYHEALEAQEKTDD